MGEPDGLPSMGSHKVGHDWSDLAAAAAAAAAVHLPVPGVDYKNSIRTSLAVQWLRLRAVNAGVDAGGMGYDPWLKN